MDAVNARFDSFVIAQRTFPLKNRFHGFSADKTRLVHPSAWSSKPRHCFAAALDERRLRSTRNRTEYRHRRNDFHERDREREREREREIISWCVRGRSRLSTLARSVNRAEIKAGTTTYDNAVYPAVLDADTADSIFVAPVRNIDCVLAISRRVNAFRQRCFFPPRAPVLSSDSNASTRPSELPPRVRPDKRSLLIVPCLSLERTFVPPPSLFVSFRFVSFGSQSERCNRDNLQRVFNCVRRVYSSCKMKNYYVFLLEKL